jgi:hypothetical protein
MAEEEFDNVAAFFGGLFEDPSEPDTEVYRHSERSTNGQRTERERTANGRRTERERSANFTSRHTRPEKFSKET